MANTGQQKRIADKLKRNFVQILQQVDGLQVNTSVNAVGDYLIEVTDGSWATGETYGLIKIQESPVVGDYSVVGYPVHKLLICFEAGAVAGSALANIGYLAEIIGRAKDMGCGIDMYLSATTVKPADQATAGGTFNAGAATFMRHIRASVDTLGLGQ